MSLKTFPLIAAALGASLQFGCASGPATRDMNANFEQLWEAAAESPDVEVGTAILAGELAARRGQSEDAARFYSRAAAISTDPKVAARATQLALQSEQAELATASVRRWIALAPEEGGAYEIAARLALRAGRWDEVVSLLRQVLAQAQARADDGVALLAVAEVLVAEPLELERANKLYDAIVEGQAPSPELSYGRALVAYRFGGVAQAQAALAQALVLRPDWRQAQMLALRLHLQAGETEGAARLIRDLHVAAPKDIELRTQLGALLLEFEQLELARKEFTNALKIDANHGGALYALGLIEMDTGELDSARKRFQKLMAHPDRQSDAAYYLGRIAEMRGSRLEAMQHYREVTDGRRVLDSAIRQAVIISQQGQVDAARQFLGNLRQRFTDQELRLYQVEGELLYQVRQDEAAEEVYDAALEMYPEDADLLYGRAVVRERRGKFTEAEADLKQIIAAEPEDARALNALGYMLSNHAPDRLAEAEGFVQRALALSPNDPAIIDSLGWLHFRQGRVEQARVFLEQAWGRLKDPEVAAHLGEVLWLQGEQIRAREIWREALQGHPNHPVLRETMERLDPAI